MFKNVRLDMLFYIFVDPSFKVTTSFANEARNTTSTSKFIN